MTPQARIERVLQVHTRYRQPGGEDRAVEAERRLLESAGIEVRQLIFDNADLHEARSKTADVRLAASAIWSRPAAGRVTAAIRTFQPDVMHVHNTFAVASPSIFRAAGSFGVPVVQTLHNYRLACPAATMFRDGRPCVDCVGQPLPAPAVIHACVRGSRSQSLVAATTIALHRRIGTFSRRIDGYVALTSFQRRVLVDAGLPSDRIHVVPNFLEPDPGAGGEERAGILYVGRLAVEKGIEPLVAAAAFAPGLVEVIGDGPLIDPVRHAEVAGDLRYAGVLPGADVMERMQGALAIIVPSLWYEGFPMVVVEASATGTPVIASRLGSLEEVVEDGVTGLLVPPGQPDQLASAIQWAVEHPAELARMGAEARRRYVGRYRGPAHLASLLAVYRTVAADAQAGIGA